MKNKKNSKKLSSDSSNLFKSEISNNNTEKNTLSNNNSQEMFENDSLSRSSTTLDSTDSCSSENDGENKNFQHHLLQIQNSYKNNLKFMKQFCTNVVNQRLKRDENSS